MDIPKFVISQLVWWMKSRRYGYIQVHFKDGKMTHLIRYESTLVTPQSKNDSADPQVAQTEGGSALTLNAEAKGANHG